MVGDEKKDLIDKITAKFLGPNVKLSGGELGTLSAVFQTCEQWAEKEASPEKTIKYPVTNLPKYTGMLGMLPFVKGKCNIVFMSLSASVYICLSLSLSVCLSLLSIIIQFGFRNVKVK
jgi:hypothetical protein